jgi:hypothetical protein
MLTAWPPCSPLVQLTRANGVQMNALRIASTQGRYHYVVAATPCYARVLTLLLYCLELSPPSLSIAQACIALLQCTAIKGTLRLAFCPCH